MRVSIELAFDAEPDADDATIKEAVYEYLTHLIEDDSLYYEVEIDDD